MNAQDDTYLLALLKEHITNADVKNLGVSRLDPSLSITNSSFSNYILRAKYMEKNQMLGF